MIGPIGTTLTSLNGIAFKLETTSSRSSGLDSASEIQQICSSGLTTSVLTNSTTRSKAFLLPFCFSLATLLPTASEIKIGLTPNKLPKKALLALTRPARARVSKLSRLYNP